MSWGKIFWGVFIIVFNLIVYLVGVNNDIAIRGIFISSVLGSLIMFVPKEFNLWLYVALVLMLFWNLITLSSNTFIGGQFLIPPLIGSGDEVYKQEIIRYVSIFGVEFPMRRSTGIADNIHVSGFLNLVLAYLSYHKRWTKVFLFSSLILILNLNLQFIIIYLLWLYIERYRNVVSIKKIIGVYIPTGVLSLFLFDQIFLSGGYAAQIFSTKWSLLFAEFQAYLNILNIWTTLYGLPVGHEDFFDVAEDYYIPLVDIGLVGIPLQFGLLGVISILLLLVVWMKYSQTNLKFFFSACLLSVLHYFSMVSSIGIISIFLLMKVRPYLSR